MRFILFIISTICTMLMFTLFVSMTGLMDKPDTFGIAYMFILLVAIAGTFFSVTTAKLYMRWSLNLQAPNVNEQDKYDEINYQIKRVALSSGIRPPEFLTFESKKSNALLLGYNKNKTIVAISSEMIESFTAKEISGVIAPLIASSKNGNLQTKMLLMGLMNSFLTGMGQFCYDKILKSGGSELVAKIIYNVFFLIGLIIFNLPTYLILRYYIRKTILKNDTQATVITSYMDIVSGLSRVGTKDCSLGLSKNYISFVGIQKDKDNIFNPCSTIPIRINKLIDQREKQLKKHIDNFSKDIKNQDFFIK